MELRPANRLFVALELPAAARARLHPWAGRLAAALGGRAVPVGNLHVTLHFIGRAPPWRGPALAAAVRAALRGPPVRVGVGGVRALPSSSRARVIAAELTDPEGTLAVLHARLGVGLAEALGRAPEGLPLLPHVTLVRFRAPAPDLGGERLAEIANGGDGVVDVTEQVFDVSRCALYDSRQIAGGPPRYDALVGGRLEPVS